MKHLVNFTRNRISFYAEKHNLDYKDQKSKCYFNESMFAEKRYPSVSFSPSLSLESKPGKCLFTINQQEVSPNHLCTAKIINEN